MEFSSLQYFRAMAPIDVVIDAFIDQENDRLSTCSGDSDVWSIESQNQFALLIASSRYNKIDLSEEHDEIDWGDLQFFPSEQYVHKLVKRYTVRLEMENRAVEDDNLAGLICYLTRLSLSNLPDPTNPSIVRYQVSVAGESNAADYQQIKDDLLSIRIYPQNNDVGVVKVWEAGAALAEYIIHNPQVIKERNVVELGAGVGLTGLVAAACGTKSMHMTDYTVQTLENIAFNVRYNERWLLHRGVDSKNVRIVSRKMMILIGNRATFILSLSCI